MQIRTTSLNLGTSNKNFETTKYSLERSFQKELEDQKKFFEINDITYVLAKLSDSPKIKFPVHSHLKYILQKIFKMTGVN